MSAAAEARARRGASAGVQRAVHEAEARARAAEVRERRGERICRREVAVAVQRHEEPNATKELRLEIIALKASLEEKKAELKRLRYFAKRNDECATARDVALESNRVLVRRQDELTRELETANQRAAFLEERRGKKQELLDEQVRARQAVEQQAERLEAKCAGLEAEVRRAGPLRSQVKRLEEERDFARNELSHKVQVDAASERHHSRQGSLSLVASPVATTPTSRHRQIDKHAKRRAAAHKELIAGIRGVDIAELAIVLDGIMAGEGHPPGYTLIDLLFDSAPVWLRKMVFGAQLVELHNRRWDAVRCVRMQADHHLSSRTVDNMRYDFSHDVIAGCRPRKSVVLVNPHRSWDLKSYIYFAQPFPSRAVWEPVLRLESSRFELILPVAGDRDITQRDFLSSVQALATRDESLLLITPTSSHIEIILGFDGADDFVHFLARLGGYKREVKAESEAKGVQLAIGANSDDHYPSLQVLLRSLGPAINAAHRSESTITLGNKFYCLLILWCLDLSASRSLYGRRTNASPHTENINPHLVLPHPPGITWALADSSIARAMPWLSVTLLHLDAHVPTDGELPFACKRRGCCFKLENADEREAYLQSVAVTRANRSKTGIKATAKMVAAHAPLHGGQLPGQPPLTTVEPINNLVDLLHAMDINLPDKLVKYTYLDPLILADRPDAREAIYNFYLQIGCNLDVRESDPNKRGKSWFHGSVWHYDYVMGANRKSFGLKVNTFICNLIVYGLQDADIETAEKTGIELVDDIPTRPSKKKKLVISRLSRSTSLALWMPSSKPSSGTTLHACGPTSKPPTGTASFSPRATTSGLPTTPPTASLVRYVYSTRPLLFQKEWLRALALGTRRSTYR